MRAATVHDDRPRLQPQLQDDAAYDTLDDLDIANVPSLKALYTAVLGAAMEQADVCGVLLTGTRAVGARDEASWGKHMVRFGPQSETWRIRSSPKGRIGKPLVPGELRKVAVMVQRGAGGAAKVTLLRLWLAQHALDDAPATATGGAPSCRRREEATFGAHGVNFFGLHLFEHHGRSMLSAHPDQPGRDNYYVVNGSFVSVTEPVAAQGVKPRVLSVQPCPIAHIKLAFSLTGADHAWPAMGPTPCARSSVRERFESRRTLMRAGFAERVVFAEQKRLADAAVREGADAVARLSLSDVAVLRHRATTLLAASEALCEQLSCTGVLDATCDPFFAPVLPDALRKPNGALLIIAIAVRIACYPARYGLPESTPEDAVVAREASLLLEAVEGAVFPRGVSDDNDEPIYAIDIVAAHTRQRFFEHVEHMRKAAPGDTDELDQVSARAKAALEALYCTGIGLCADVLGAEPQVDAAGAAAAMMGRSESCRDPVRAATAEAARARGLRPLRPRLAPVRGSARGAQQMALARTLLRVERWLRSGACENGVVVAAPAAATATATLAHCFSPGTSPSPSPTPTTPTAVAVAPTRGRAETQAVLAEAIRTAADDVAATKGSSKKKMRRALRQGARRMTATATRLGLQPASTQQQQQREDAAMQSTMGARGRWRARFETCLVDEILGSLRGMGAVPQRLQLPNGVRLNGPTLDEASGILSETLQCGATFVADFQAFLVSQGARNRCCDCEAVVGVAESVAFGGDSGACRNCRHPRCLPCAQRRIRRSDAGGVDGRDGGDGGDERCRFCGGEACAA